MKQGISVVVPTHNRAERLMATLESLLKQKFKNYEVIVVDDGSTDDTGKRVAALAKKSNMLRYFKERQGGPAVARNLGIRKSKNEIVAFTDDDCLVPPDWLARLADAYGRFPEVAGVGGYLKPRDDELKRSLFAQLEWVEAVCTYGVDMEEKISGEEGVVGGTANMSYRKSVLEEVGGFDENFPWAAGEDVDLKIRIVGKGNKLLYTPVEVVHNREYDLKGFLAQARTRGLGGAYFRAKYGRENKVVLLLKIVLSPLLFLKTSFEYKRKCGSWHVRVAIIKTIGVIYSGIYSLL
ncbi:glycosyltransferase family 2 protein [Candidatus Micrarchaeota archaeon]|nr:glycosyltransferase family 2 protein [Candidatus Micrarchaeota archaeon]